jgi:hypothetical protein
MSSEKIEELVEGMTGIIVDQICSPVLEFYQSDEEDPGHSKADNDKNLRFFLTERTYTYDEMREEFGGVDFGVVEKTLGKRKWAKIAEFDISGKYFNYFPAPECSEAAFVFVAHINILTVGKMKGFDEKKTTLSTKNRFTDWDKNIDVHWGNILWNENRLSVDIFVTSIGLDRFGQIIQMDEEGESPFPDEEPESRAESVSLEPVNIFSTTKTQPPV